MEQHGMEYVHRRREIQLLADAKGIYLDGKKAHVAGTLQEFATVWTPADLQGVQFSWEAVERIVKGHGPVLFNVSSEEGVVMVTVKTLRPIEVMDLLWPDPQAPAFPGSWDAAAPVDQMRVLFAVRGLMAYYSSRGGLLK